MRCFVVNKDSWERFLLLTVPEKAQKCISSQDYYFFHLLNRYIKILSVIHLTDHTGENRRNTLFDFTCFRLFVSLSSIRFPCKVIQNSLPLLEKAPLKITRFSVQPILVFWKRLKKFTYFF